MVTYGLRHTKHLAQSVLACHLLFSAFSVQAQEQSHRYMARVVPAVPDHSPKLLFVALVQELGADDLIHDRDHGLLVFRSEADLSFAQVDATVQGADFVLLHLAQDERDPLSYLNASALGPVPVYEHSGQCERDMAEYLLAIDAWRLACSATIAITE